MPVSWPRSMAHGGSMRKIVLVLSLLALVGAACSKGSSAPASPSARAPSASPTVDCPDESTGTVFDITMQDNVFIPSCLTAASSQTLRLSNEGTNLHNFSIKGTVVDVDVPPGQVDNLESAGLPAGTYSFFCKYHQQTFGMEGTITVV